MKNITTYYATRKNPLVWLCVLCMIASAAARIVFAVINGTGGLGVVVVHILLPLAANLLFTLVLLDKGARMFYVTRGAAIFFAAYYVLKLWTFGLPFYMTAACILLCIFMFAMYYMTYGGKFKTKWFLVIVWLLPGLFALDPQFRDLFLIYFDGAKSYMIADIGIWAGLFFAILATRKFGPWKEGEPICCYPGDRSEGRLVRTKDPMGNLQGFLMVKRNESNNLLADTIETSAMDRYIHQKRREGLKHFGVTHVIMAAYVRCCAELPGVNRFFAGQRTFHRNDITINLVVKKEMGLNQPDSMIKAHFKESDTANDVYEKVDALINQAKDEDTSFDGGMRIFDSIPRLLMKFVVWFLKLIDYFSLFPDFLEEFSPFHASMFMNSMASLGIPPTYHHLYDFGTIPVFLSFGAKRTVRELDDNGNVVKRKYIDYLFNTDERTCDGYYYAAVLKKFRSLMAHPERLDLPPEEIVEDIE